MKTHVRKKIKKIASIRRTVYERDDYKCRYCSRDMKEAYLLWRSLKGTIKIPCVPRAMTLARVGISIDHVVPVSKGGRFVVENLVTACKRCNQKKAAQDLQDFMLSIPGYIPKKRSFMSRIVTLMKKIYAKN